MSQTVLSFQFLPGRWEGRVRKGLTLPSPAHGRLGRGHRKMKSNNFFFKSPYQRILTIIVFLLFMLMRGFAGSSSGVDKVARFHRLKCSGVESFKNSENNQQLLAQLIVQKEEELKRSILPGKLPPKATVVASLRKEVAELRQQLRQAMGSTVPARTQSSNSSTQHRNTNIKANSKLKNMNVPSAGLSMTARETLLLMERSASGIDDRQMALMASSGAWPEGEQLAELEALTQENALLKSRLAALSEHQRKLNALKERLKGGSTKAPDVKEKEESTKKVPARPRKARTTSSPATKTRRRKSSNVEKDENIEKNEKIEAGLLEKVLV